MLIGTIVKAPAETIIEINTLIDDYNADFGTNLPHVVLLVDKLDNGSFINGTYSNSDFDWYEQDDNGNVSVDIFDAFDDGTTDNSVKFTSWNVTGFNNPVLAFEQKSGPTVEYYVSKDGNKGWSLWLAMAGMNPFYTDEGVGSSSITGSGFTRGSISNTSLDYDPIKNSVSHLSFYRSAGGDNVIPEPGTVAIWSVLALAGLAIIRRRK